MEVWHDVLEIRAVIATATSYVDALLRIEHRGFNVLHVVASYDDELVRIDNGWQIRARRCETYLWRREHV